MEYVKHGRRHRVVWQILRGIIPGLTKLKFNYHCDYADIEGPYLVVSNHNSDWDPLLVGSSFKRQMYFVTSEHILRGRWGRIISWLVDPIGRQKGGSAADTVMTMLRRLKNGYNVMVFPEGNRSWDGVTHEFPAAIGKLARASGAKLVTYRLEGAYFANPRWAGSAMRKGYMYGHVVKVYSPAELKAMTAAEVDKHIFEDVYEDAYAVQEKKMIEYKGKRLAEHMETLLFLCPNCGGIHTLHSHDDTVHCDSCGLRFRYLPTGFLEGEGLRWNNLRDWSRWQDEEILRMCREAGDGPIFTDVNMQTYTVEARRRRTLLGSGELKLYRDRVELPGNIVIPLEELVGVSLRGPQDIYFGTASEHYQVGSEEIRCTLKYLRACSYFNEKVSFGV